MQVIAENTIEPSAPQTIMVGESLEQVSNRQSREVKDHFSRASTFEKKNKQKKKKIREVAGNDEALKLIPLNQSSEKS